MMSCSSSQKQLEVQVKPVQTKRVIHPRPVGVPAPDIDMELITPEIMESMLAELASGDRQAEAYWSFKESSYLTFAQWLQDMLRYTKATDSLISAYESDAEDYNHQIDSVAPIPH